jgi:hypothetical protein
MGNRPEKYKEPFIPEGLEFREEYMDAALNLYKATKRSLFIKKVFVYGGIAALLTGIVLIICLNNSKPSDSALNKEQNASAIGRVETNGELYDTNLDQSKSLNNSEEVAHKNELVEHQSVNSMSSDISSDSPVSDSKILKSKSAFDHGGPTSSGVGSPDRKSIVGEKKINSEKSNQEFLLVESADKITNESNRKENVSEFSNEQFINLSSSSASAKSESNVVDITNSEVEEVFNSSEKSRIIFGDINKLQYQPGGFFARDFQLISAKGIGTTSIKKFIPYLQVGIIPLSSYGSQKNDLRADPFASIGCDYRTKSHLLLGARLNYFSVSGLSHPYEVSQTEYGQGFYTNTTTYFTERLHYVSLSPVLSKVFFSNHQLFVGGDIEYLITGNNRIENGNYTSLEKGPTSSQSARGYVGVFNDINYAVNMGYQYWLGKNKAIGLNYKLGLTDISKEEYFKNDVVDKNSMLSLYFRMNLR